MQPASNGNTPVVRVLLALGLAAVGWAAAAARRLLASGAGGRVKNHAGKTPAQAVPEAAHGGELHRLLLAAAGE